MAYRNGFNGKCLIEFTYRRTKGEWRLVKNKIDPRIKRMLGKDFFCGLRKQLRKMPNAYRPPQHESIICNALSPLRLDQSIMVKAPASRYRLEGQTYSVQIVVSKRHEKKAHGLATL
jgi:hypothetical protein